MISRSRVFEEIAGSIVFTFRTRPHHSKRDPVIPNASPLFQTRPHRSEHDLVILNASPLFKRDPITPNATRHSECKPISSNASPPFRTRPHHFEREPIVFEHGLTISNASPLFRTKSHHFECESIVLNMSPSFRTLSESSMELLPSLIYTEPSLASKVAVKYIGREFHDQHRMYISTNTTKHETRRRE